MNKATGIILFSLLAAFLGAIAGAIVWVALKIINVLTDVIWEVIPQGNSLVYNLIVCLIGAVLIGLFQKKFGILPDDMEQVMEKIHETGGYPYNRLGVIAVAAILPLIFGGALGPEAGLTGLIAGLCCWIGDSMKHRKSKLMEIYDNDTLAETGYAVVLGVVFGAPLFGIIGNIEPDNRSEKYKEKLLNKKGRIFIYCMGVAGGILAMKGLGALWELVGLEGGGGLPRFERSHEIDLEQWKWFVPLFAAGLILAFLYKAFQFITLKLAARVHDYRIISCLIAGVCVAFAGYFLPFSMFSGEHQLGELMTGYEEMSVTILILTAIMKLFLVNACISFGWRGGAIFPIIFSGSAAGFALAIVFGMDGAFAVAIVVAAMYAYIMRKPGTVVAVLLLCFPVTYLVPIIIAAIISSKIPAPWDKKTENKKQENNNQEEQK